MTSYLFDPEPVRAIPLVGETALYPISRIFCVGRNYEAHAREMGGVADREAPFYFTKSATTAVPTGATIPYPPGTSNYHYEMELVMVIGAPVFKASKAEAATAILGYCTGLDMTRRDRQQDGKDKRRPWDLGKDFENAAVFGPITRAEDFGEVAEQRIHLSVNGEIRQDARLSELVHNCTDVIVHLSQYYHLKPGDVIMTGTPAGVGAVTAGDKITGGIEGLEPIALTIGAAE